MAEDADACGTARAGGRHGRLVLLVLWLLLAVSVVQFAMLVPLMYGWPKWDFTAYYHSAMLIRGGRPADIYGYSLVGNEWRTLGYLHEPSPYLYPPLLAILFVPVTLVGYRWASTLWFGAGILELVLSAAVLVACMSWQRRISGRRLTAAILLLLTVALRFSGAQTELCLGNVNLAMLLLTCAALWFTTRGRDVAAGALLAAAFCVKLTPGIFVLYYVLTRRWKAVLSFAVVSAVLTGLTVPIMGVEAFGRFADTVRELSRGSSTTENQSWNGFCNRLFATSRESVAPVLCAGAVPWVSRLGSAVVLVVTLAACWRRRTDAFCVFGLLACAACLASPATWPPHLVVLMIPLAWLLAQLVTLDFEQLRPGQWAAITGAVLLLSWLLILEIRTIAKLPVHGFIPVMLISRRFFGIVVLWVAVLAASRAALAQSDFPEGAC